MASLCSLDLNFSLVYNIRKSNLLVLIKTKMSKKILIVEDEEIMSGLLKRKLSEEGYDVQVAEDGEKGLEQVKALKPDLVLLDIMMPKKGGFEVMEEIRADEAIKDTKVIVISNSGQPVELDRAKKLEAVDWLIKTEFDPKEVIEKVKQQIG